LLDDIFDKLDDNRVKKLIQLAGDDSFGQAFITDTKKERIENIFREIVIDHKLFRIFDGRHSML
jgi:DNA replication and repair protein RecF